MGGLEVTDITREIIPLLCSSGRERALVKGVGLNVGDAKYPCVYRRTKLPGGGVHSTN